MKLLNKFLVSLISFQLFSSSLGCENKTITQILKNKDWWETASFYQIYPRSFKDSNGDGIGDLNGITEKLDYLKEIGVDAVWLSPIFMSPMVDFGYDISNYFDIQPEYGTLQDFDKLIKKANELGIKIILDFVPNHTSDKSEWFKKSVKREKGYENFYVWSDGIIDPKNVTNRLPPSNWLQAFRGSAWQWNEERKQFYLHQFTVQQPDLNYRNPNVFTQMNDVLTYWLEKGVAGFRVDAVPQCFEVLPNSDGTYPNEPPSGLTEDKDDSDYLKHIYTQDQPETIELVYEWRRVLDDFTRVYGGDSKILLIETWSPLDYTMKFYGNRTVNGAQIPFNFKFIQNSKININAADIIKTINEWTDNMPGDRVPNWVLGNHDRPRVSTQYGVDRIDTMKMIQMMLPGVSVTYMGEEIGMLDADLTWNDTVDPAACNSNPQIYKKFSRDPERTPFQWDNTENAGFSKANKTWLPVENHYKEINVKKELNDSKSHLKIFKALTQLRKESKAQIYGDLKLHSINKDNVLVLIRFFDNKQFLILVANINKKKERVNLKEILPTIPSSLKIKISNVSSQKNSGDSISTTEFSLDPHETLVLFS